tara:strand:+ start:4165 stop:4332 length:168 start_codon:yes stop_codon:yes gene_type:complete
MSKTTMEIAVETQEITNILLADLLKNVKRSNKILMMVNGVNIMTIIVLLLVVVLK